MPDTPLPASVSRPAADGGATRRMFAAAQQILAIADIGILASDAHGRITEFNPDACRMFGYSEAEMADCSVYQLLPPDSRQRHQERMQRFVDSEESERRAPARQELTGYRKDGSEFPIEASIALFRERGAVLLVVTLRDITERKLAEAELTRRASHDVLTGLPNRALICERLSGALARSRRGSANVALLFVDLDGFKLINDYHGHASGDLLLQGVAARLLAQVRAGESVARLAGDEFVVLCEQVDEATSIGVLAERIRSALRPPFDCHGQALNVTASIGVAIGHGATHSADDMLRYADTAMYAVKQKGRDGWQFFNENVHAQAKLRLQITHGLRGALQGEQLSLRFQPIVVADSGRIIGAELLLRWFPPEGEISPAVFIPVAETTGSIVPIGAWVFGQACRAEAAWRRRWGSEAPYVSVNVSTRQLNEESLADDFAAQLQATGADPARLLLEITETALMTDVEANLQVLRRLADLGLRVAVDDFGTGYSSLAQLTRLPVDVLKIDRAFVDGIDTSPESRTVIRAVIGLGRALGLKLVAEGVETAAQRLELCAFGCDFIQGYHFHRPMPEAAFVDTVERERRDGPASAGAPLHFLIYVSQASVALGGAEMEALLATSRLANRAAGITGCLMQRDGCYMQMLEGREEELAALMVKIRASRRHHGLRIVMQGPAQRRVFADWSMALRDVSACVDAPDFTAWPGRAISFLELAEDPRTCYAYLTGCGLTH